MLEPGDAVEVDLVARRAGYESATTMRAQFATQLHTAAARDRRTFRGPRS